MQKKAVKQQNNKKARDIKSNYINNSIRCEQVKQSNQKVETIRQLKQQDPTI